MESNSLVPAGPQRPAETSLQTGDSPHVRPQLAFDDARQTRMPDAGGFGDAAQTAITDRLDEVQREASRDLPDGIAGRDSRPVDGQLPRRRTGGSSHGASVLDSASGGGPMADREQRWRKQLRDYSPRIDGEAWAMIRPRLLEWMEQIGPAPVALTKDLLFNLTRLAAHCWEQGWDLTPETVLSEAIVEHHIALRVRKGHADNPHARTTLRQARLTLVDGEPLGVRFTRPQRHRSPAPFDPADYSRIESWAKSRRDANHRRTACAIAALGMGAGLRAAEMAGVRRADVLHLPGGLSVNVTVGHPRTVPLLHDWEPLLHLALEEAGETDHLVGVTGEVSGGNYVGDFTTKSGGPDSRRMRVTWLVTHLQFGTPLDLLLATAGNTTLDSFQRYLDHVQRDSESADRLMRGSGAVR